ncbi:MAG: hypothetical protein P4L62_01530 [Candidatus Pacebacteria bacterium]|nr:hypothetical protein [Candidatus Paceibacterota bacterium]MDR3583019.1 hypothetical protein [Candidatus Paceibacterota bacterium]
MKVKILLMPLTIVIAIALLIWYVYPAFSNGSDGMLDKYGQLKKENAQLTDLEGKSSNVDGLASQLDSNPGDKTTMMEFIPDQIEEEQVVDNLNYLASSNGLAVLNISISQPTIPTATTPDSSGDAAAPADSSESAPVATDFSVKYSVFGTYDQVKGLLGKLNSFGRYNDVSSLDIEKQTSQQDSSAATDSLKADLVLNFNYFKPVALSSDTSQVFLSSKLDTSVIDQIKSSQNVPVLHLSVGQMGKSNPFIP